MFGDAGGESVAADDSNYDVQRHLRQDLNASLSRPVEMTEAHGPFRLD